MARVLEFQYYNKDKLCSEIRVDYNIKEVFVKNYVDNPLQQAFGKRPNTLDTVDEFFKERCFDVNRPDKYELLESIGLKIYEPEAICRKTNGLTWDDTFWICFMDEPVSYEEIAKRKGW